MVLSRTSVCLAASLVAAVSLAPVGVFAVSFVSSQANLDASAFAQIFLDTSTPTDSDSDSASATDVLVFSDSVTASALVTEPGEPSASGSGFAIMDANFASDSIMLSGGASAFGTSDGISQASGDADIFYEVVFTAAGATAYNFDMNIDADSGPFGSASVSITLLDSLGGTIFTQSATGFAIIEATEAGTLAAGTYTLRLVASVALADLGGAFTGFNIRGVIPEPGTFVLVAPGLAVLAARRRAACRRRAR